MRSLFFSALLIMSLIGSPNAALAKGSVNSPLTVNQRMQYLNLSLFVEGTLVRLNEVLKSYHQSYVPVNENLKELTKLDSRITSELLLDMALPRNNQAEIKYQTNILEFLTYTNRVCEDAVALDDTLVQMGGTTINANAQILQRMATEVNWLTKNRGQLNEYPFKTPYN